METEKQLLFRIKDGERGAQRRLYERFAGYLMAVCLRYLTDREAAEERGIAEGLDDKGGGERIAVVPETE